MKNVVIMALIATLGTWLLTAIGAATIVFFKKTNISILNLMLGFAAGVMIAASFWSLLQPAIDRAEEQGRYPAFLVATSGFLAGAGFMWLTDKIVIWARNRTNNENATKNDKANRILMLILSITLHNIPEGLAVGVAFGALGTKISSIEEIMGAISIALGIGLQNFPEGAAVSIPLRREGFSRAKCFFYGQASGMVEPIAGVIGAALVVYIETVLPFMLSFAAGAMILVAVHELIPECQRNNSQKPYTATAGIVVGFAVMMLLDVMLG